MKKLLFFIAILICSLLIISCSKNDKDKKEANKYTYKITPYNPQQEDSISYNLWYATAFFTRK